MNYKLFHRLIAVVLALLVGLFAGCEDKITEVLSLSATNEYTIPAEGGSVTLPIISNQPWTATVSSANGAPDWLTLSHLNGITDQVVIVSIDTNVTKDEREAVVEFTGAGKTKTVTITQDGSKITVSKLAAFTAYGGEAVVSVTSFVPWTFTSSTATWFQTQRAGDSIKITVNSYEINTERKETITIKAPGLSDVKLTITQASAKINVSRSVDLGSDGGTRVLPVDCIKDWVLTPGTHPAWVLALNRLGTSKFDTINIVSEANPYYFDRKDTLQFTAAGLDDVRVPLKQPMRTSLFLGIYDPGDPLTGIGDTLTSKMAQGTSKEKRKEYTWKGTLRADTRLLISLVSRENKRGPMFGAASADLDVTNANGQTSLPYIFENDAIYGSNINTWHVTAEGTYSITVVLHDNPDTLPTLTTAYIKFKKE